MFVIRKGCFETNSSSMDYYGDYEDNTPTDTKATQNISVELEFEDDVSNARMEEILNEIVEGINDGNDLGGKIDEAICTGFTDEEVYDLEAEVDGDCFVIYYTLSIPIHFEGEYYPQTKYSPEEYPELVWDVDGLFSDKNKTVDKEDEVIKELSAAIKKEYREVRRVVKFYISELDVEDPEY